MCASDASKRPGRPADPDVRLRREEEILDAAARLFAEHGYADAATQDLADRLQVGKGTLYRYFPTKRDLFLAAVDRVMRLVRQEIDGRIAPITDPIERIKEGCHAYLGFFAEHPQFVELLIQERAQFKDRNRPAYVEWRYAHVDRWRQLYRELIAAGRIRDVPVERITEVIGDLLYGTMFTNYFTGRHRDPARQAEEILDTVFNGIFTDAERQRRAAAPPAGDNHSADQGPPA